MFKKIIIVIVAVIAIILILAATKPDTFRIQRTATIKATPDKIFPFINDFRNWQVWSPYEKLDPRMKRKYSGVPSGKGAVYEWAGNGNVGAGRMEIIESSQPINITIKLDFSKPIAGHNIAEFTLVPKGNSTEITWAMAGPTPFIGKIIHVFFDMDKMIGKSFEDGLANLKTLTEK